jgi:Tfp pilus assembly protein PilN
MAQQLNLLDARFAPRPQRLSARHGLMALATVVLLSAGAVQGLRWSADSTRAEAREIERQAAPLRARRLLLLAQSSGPLADDLARIRQVEAGQQRIVQALAAGAAGAREGHADYLEALARRASPALWLTGFSVSEDSKIIELTGRMSDTRAMASYLRSLNEETRFRGRGFAQLSLNAVDTQGQLLPYTEFTLTSKPRPAGVQLAANTLP